jgi:2-oxoglutarate dehydrogenase E2 component (dihydrolipoamide succinyltransferase)
MPTDILVPDLGESVIEATVLRWIKAEGERVSAGEPLVELETEKVNLDITAPSAGVLARIARRAGEDVKIGDVLGVIEAAPGDMKREDGPEPAARPEAAPAVDVQPAAVPKAMPADTSPAAPSVMPPVDATPIAQRMAAEYGLDLRDIAADVTGRRVTKQDVEAFLEKREPQSLDQSSLAAPERQAQDRREERVKLSRRRQTIARRLVEAQQTAAMLTTFNELDMGAVMELRKAHKESFKQRHRVGLGLTAFFVRAVVGALKDFPRLNAELEGDELVLKQYFDIGIAVGAEEGLVVPVLREADRMTFVEIERRVHDFVQRSAANKLTVDDLRGGTFTITNGGVFGSLFSTPILNTPQVGILGLHKIEDRPIARDGQVMIRPMMYAALTYDHRVVDGREAVGFLVRVKELIQEPGAMLLEG